MCLIWVKNIRIVHDYKFKQLLNIYAIQRNRRKIILYFYFFFILGKVIYLAYFCKHFGNIRELDEVKRSQRKLEEKKNLQLTTHNLLLMTINS